MGLYPGFGLYSLTFYFVGTLLLLGFAPNVLDIEPRSYNQVLVPKFTGAYEPNRRLDKSERLFENILIGPESLALYKGDIYTGLHTGEIIRIRGDKYTKVAQIGKPCEGHWEPEVCGRTLGLRPTKEGKLYAADAYYGLYTVDINTGAKNALLPMTTKVDGIVMKFPDDLDVDQDGVVYMSDVSTKWGLDDIVFPAIEHCNRGRIIKYDPKSGKATAIMKNLHFPNGVQLTHDGKGLLVAELLKHRILRYNLEGPKKGKTEVFANVPGEPDNIRPSPRGGYWVAMVSARNASTPNVMDYFTEYPKVRKVAARISYGIGSFLRFLAKYVTYPAFKEFAHKFQKQWYIMPLMVKRGTCMVIELDKDGQAVQSLQSTDTRLCYVSEVLEHEGHLYLGSFINPYLTKVKL